GRLLGELRVLGADQARDEPLPAGRDEQTVVEAGERVEGGQYLPIVFGVLRESQTRVDDDVRRVHTHVDGLVDAGAQLGDHLGDDVIAVEGRRGPVEIAAPVHEHDGGGRLRGEVEHGGIRLSGGHIVDEVG